MTKTLTYLLLIVVLGMGVYFFVFKERDLFAGNEASFKTADTGSIAKIFLADKFNNSVTLKRGNKSWVISDSYPVSQAAMNTLLRTLATQETAYPVPETMHDNVIKALAANAIKVELYGSSGDIIKVFYVGGQANNSAGSFMLMDDAQQAYVVQIPGFPGYLTPRYSPHFADWRDRLVCNIPAADLKSVRIDYPAEPKNSFTFNRSADGEIAVMLDPALNFPKSSFNVERADSYSKFFERLYCEGYINGITDLDSIIMKSVKRCMVDIESHSGKAQHIEVYWMALNKRSKNRITPFPGVPAEFDADRYYGVINDFKDTVILQRQSFEKIFRKGYEFYMPDDTSANAQETPLRNRAGSIIINK